MTEEPLPPELEIDSTLPEGLKVTTERPYRILLVTDLASAPNGSVAGPLLDQVVEVNADSFDQLLSEARPTISFNLADPTRTDNALTRLELRFDSLKAFTPPRVLEQLAPTRSLRSARQAIVARLRGERTAAQLAETVQRLLAEDSGLAWLNDALRWAPAPRVSSDAVDAALGQVDLGEGSGDQPPPAVPKSPIGAVVAAAAAGGGVQIPAEEAAALRRGLSQIDHRLTAWLQVVLHAPVVQRLEAAWRGLGFLVSRMDFRRGLRLAVLHAPRGELAQRLTTLVIDPVFDAGAEAPDLIAVDALFGNSATDLELLDELAQHAASLPVVLLTGASAEFFGVKNAWQVPTLPPIVSLFDQWQFAKWNTLRGQPYARSLGLIFGRGLLRSPCDGATGDSTEFRYREECLADRDFVWTSGAVAAACTIARSVAEIGWPTNMVGRLEGFAVGQGGKKNEKQFGPADVQMPLDKAQEMAAAGLNVLLNIPRQSEAFLCNGFSAARPTRAEGFALLEVSLPYQLFACRLSSLLLELKPHILNLPADKLAAFVLAHVRDWLTVADTAPDEQQVSVQARPLDDDPNSLQLAVTVTPPLRILPGGVPVVLGYRVR